VPRDLISRPFLVPQDKRKTTCFGDVRKVHSTLSLPAKVASAVKLRIFAGHTAAPNEIDRVTPDESREHFKTGRARLPPSRAEYRLKRGSAGASPSQFAVLKCPLVSSRRPMRRVLARALGWVVRISSSVGKYSVAPIRRWIQENAASSLIHADSLSCVYFFPAMGPSRSTSCGG
jgi:hypothetical protein